MRLKRRSVLVGLLALAGACGCQARHGARLSDAAGLAEGSPVYVSGVQVGEVRSVRVVEQDVEVLFTIEREHEITLHADACGLAGRVEDRPALVVLPGQVGELDSETLMPQCQLTADDLNDLGAAFGELFEGLMRSLGQGFQGLPQLPGMPAMPGPTPGAPGGPATGPNPPTPLPPPPLPPGTATDGCEAVRFRVDRTEPVGAMPAVLPAGGQRVWLAVDNQSDVDIEIGPSMEATFVTVDGQSLRPALLPDQDGWFMPFTVPAHSTHTTSVVFTGGSAPRLDRIRAGRSSIAGRPLEQCTVESSGLSAP